jgi:signal transduction histidine kinase
LKRFFSKNSPTRSPSPADSQGRPERKELLDLFIHDLRVPLSIVATSTEKLLQKKDLCGSLTETQQRILDRILRNSRKAQNLVQDMIEVFRSEAGIFRMQPFLAEEILRMALLDVLDVTIGEEVENIYQEDSAEGFKQRVAKQGIVIQISGLYARKSFDHDPRKVRQILRNLISNGMKFYRQQLVIAVSGEHDLLISVEDDGPGIPLDGQTRIFERFTRLNHPETEQISGLGLGLSGVKSLVEAMGGAISVNSREGSGSRFDVRIPPLTDRKEASR